MSNCIDNNNIDDDVLLPILFLKQKCEGVGWLADAPPLVDQSYLGKWPCQRAGPALVSADITCHKTCVNVMHYVT